MSRILFDLPNDGPFNFGGADPNGLNNDGVVGHVAPSPLEAAPAPVDPTQAAQAGSGTVSLTTTGTAFTQDFNTLSNTAGSTTNTTMPTGWYFLESLGGARDNGQYAVDTGGSTTADTYSYGAAGSTERALGQLRSGTLASVIGSQFTNDTGGAIGSLQISYDGEQWRFGGVHSTVPDKMDFQISYDATSLSTGTWVDVNTLDFNPLITTGTAGALDGNAAANHTTLSSIISGLNIAAGATFWIRWVDQDATGADDGLAIDNFSITASAAVASPGSLTVADQSIAEGNSGDTDMVFTVTRAGGSAGAVSATYTITNGTTDAADFGTGFVSTGTVNFADGATTAQIHIPIAGDTTYEPNETFSLALSAPTGGATLGAHSTATGTITNDDAPPAGTLSIANASVAEGDSGDTDMAFTVTRANGSVGAVSATYTITLGSGTGFASTNDFGASFTTIGTVSFADGATTAQIHVPIHGDTTYEPNETFSIALSAPTGGASIGTGTATGTITNDDAPPPPANVYINEIHYDNASTDAGEAIEIAGVAGTDLSAYSLVFYDGTNTPGAATVYRTQALSGTIDDEGSGYGAVSFSFPVNGIQNGASDGVALIGPGGVVIQLLSYEGTFTAAAGTPAAGMKSVDIGVLEDGSGALGQSLQLTGSGASYADFTWQSDSTSSFGSLNANQIIIADNATGQVHVADASVVEGNSGTSNLTFTVYRAGGLGSAASVDYSFALDGTADSNDIGPGAVLSGTINFAVGASSATISIPIVGDTVGEPNETLSLHIGNPTGNIAITDDTGVGTILNDDFVALTIAQIQGAGHTSQYVGQPVQTTGIVTAVDTNGFYMQMAVGDGDAATSDAIFVFTSTAPTVVVGDGVTVGGTVTEFAGDAQGLTTTELNSPVVTIDSHGNALPAAIVIGNVPGGILPPTQNLDDDHLTTYDPVHDGLDFWESLEGMRVTLDSPQAVSNTDSFGDTFMVASHGSGATGMNDRGGITISPNGDGTVDYNPEMIQVIGDSGIYSGYHPNYTVGDQLSSITGIVNYAFDNYNLVVTAPVTVTNDVTLTRETTTLQSNSDYLSLATYNLENMDASDNKYTILASDMMFNLRAPDIIAVQEVQDADGAGSGTDLSGVSNAQGIIDAIFALTGKHYGYIEIAPTVANSTGGEPNGNIRNGYFYNIDRVTPVGSPELITGSAFNGSRNPLVQTWSFEGQNITTIDVHATSRGGSDPLRGNDQPATDAGDAQRTAQAAAVKAYVNAHLADNPNLNLAVLGDWNGFYFEQAQTQLTDPAQGGLLTNVNYLLPSQERYSYLFDGNAQQIDNILVSQNLLPVATNYDAVHLNSQFGDTRPTDHDPQVVLFHLGNSGGDSFFGTNGDDTYTIDNVNDHVYENAGGGNDTINSSITYSLADAPNVENLILTGTANIDATGSAGNNALTGNSGDNAIDGAGGTDTMAGGAGNDTYTVDSADDVVIENASEGIDTVKATVSYTLAAGSSIELLRLSGTGNIDATGNSDAQKLVGNSGDNVLDGGGGGDVMRGGAGNDTYIVRDAADRVVENDGNGTDIVKAAISYTLAADASIETLRTIDDNATTAIDLTGNSHTTLIVGNAGANHLTGGSGDEMLTGGAGADVFVFAASGVGHDTVGDFVSGTDKLDLSAYFADFASFQAATHDVGGNAVIDLGGGQNVTLSGVLSAQIQSGDVVTASGQAPLVIDKGSVQHAMIDVDVLTPTIMIHDVWSHGPAALAFL
ncbi:Calx-beta domain-containing protein [Sphingomonas sp.]|uniref:Calx-beta domain-containing protein n=1 Tax=Sphingomonas sp. TaxID=28214 RepID=UPI0025D6B914|nr:Calx-beta domain-containing protein [Sphingomonas sp.]